MKAIFRKLLMASIVISAVIGAGANSAGANDRPNSQVATAHFHPGRRGNPLYR